MKRLLTTAVALAALSTLAAGPSSAIPAFARKYGFNCTMCHSSFPRLNDFGVRFRRNGYRIPGREDVEKMVYETQTPLALRTSVGFNNTTSSQSPADNVSQFQVNGVDLLSGGLLGQNVGYFAVYTPQMTAGRGVAGQDASLEAANVVITCPKTRWLSARLGRFEPGFSAFSVKRSLTVAPYEIYDYAFPGGVAFSETQTGIEVAGIGMCGTRYTFGLVEGSGTNGNSDSPADLYLRAERVIGQGEGQTSGHRIGATLYRGMARPEAGGSREACTRVGLDATLNSGPLSLGVQYLHATDNGALWGLGNNVNVDGGFAELLYQPRTRMVGFARYDWVKTPAALEQGVSRWTIGTRYYLEDSVAIHLEYSRRSQTIPSSADHAIDKLLTIRTDFAF